MMKIRCLLLVSISYIGLCSLAQANISEGGKEFIFTHTSKGVEQTSAASFGVMKNRGLNTAAVLEHTHLLHLDSRSQLLSFQQNYPHKGQEASRLEIREQDTGNRWPHRLGGEQRDLLGTISLAVTDGPTASVASVCFITDAGNCTGAAGVGTDEGPSSSSGGPDWEIDGKEQCEQSGYDCTPCPEGQKPSGTCPFDSSCHATCVNACPVENTLTCTGADEKGVGDACDGLYASCCKLCSDYPYDEIKAGYVLTDSCKDCDGNTHYKLKCDVWGQGSGMGTYFDCGTYGGESGSGSCTDEETGDTYYKECKCPLNQEWNASSKECKCSTSFKYDCAGTNDVKPEESQSCDGKYSACECQNGFEWDTESGQCLCGGSDFCAMNQDCGAMGYKQQSCSGSLILRCPFDLSYVVCGD